MKKKETFASIFKAKRKKEELSYRALSRETGLTPSAFVRYEKGLGHPKESTLRQLCQILKMDFESMLDLVNNEKEQMFYENASYPDMRKIILSAYTEEYTPRREKVIPKNVLINEFSHYSLHPIEEKIINETSKRLIKKGSLKAGESILSVKSSSQDKEKMFKAVISEWGYIPVTEILIIGLSKKTPDKKNLLETVYFKIEKIVWKEIEGS